MHPPQLTLQHPPQITVTPNIEVVHSPKMSEHLTTTQVRNPKDDSWQIINCMKSQKLLQVRFFKTQTLQNSACESGCVQN